MGKNLFKVLTAATLFLIPGFLLSQVPNLGSASGFALFTSVGTFTNGTGGATNVTGNVGTNSGSYGFGNGTLNGTSYVANATSAQAAADLNTAFNSLTSVSCGTTISNSLGSLTLTPNVYCTAGAASISGTLTLDGQGNSNAVFIIKTGVGLTLNSGAKVNLINSASQCNVYWQVNGALTLSNNSVIRGTVLANGAIDLQQGSTVFGRALTRTGNVTLKNSTAAVAFAPTASTISAGGTTTFCTGGSVILSGNTGGTWSTGSTAASITVNSSGTYYVTNSTNCGSITSNSISVTVNPLPTVVVNSGTICNGNSIVLNASGADTYSWAPGASLSSTTGASVSANPVITTTYSVTGTSIFGCVKTTTASVTVNSNPTISVNSATICEGGSVLLTASGADTYTWNPATFLDAANGATVTSNATVTTIYTVTGTSGDCSASQTSTVTVHALPEATVSASGPTFFCQGGHVILTSSPGNSHSWSNNEATQSITVTATGDYSVTVTDDNGCAKSSSLISVLCISIPTITVNSATICEGSSTILNASGADTYSWQPSESLSASSGTSVTASPGSTTVYTITGTTTDGCTDTTTASVEVVPNPTVSVSGGTICAGTTTTLTAASADSYLWNGGETTNSISVTPNATRDYTVTGTTNGCTYTEIFEVIVNAQPGISVIASPASICSGASSTLTASGASTYLWDTGETTSSISVSPVTTTNYMLTGTGINGCSKTATVSVTVNACSTETAVSTVPCGLVLASMKSVAKAMNIVGANQYRFNFYDNTTGALVATKTQASCTFTFNTISGLYYGNTYKWTVAVDKGIGFGPESSNACTVTFVTPQTTLPCGNSCSNLNSYSTCGFVYSGSGYRFSFYNNSTNALVAVKTQTSNYIYFNTVPGLAYGNTYKWTVEVLYNNGSSMVYGAPSSSLCTMTFDPPQPSLPCGISFSNLNAYTTCQFVSGATAYRFSFYDNTTNALVAVKTQTSNYIYFNQVPGLAYGKTYKWTVAAQYNDGGSLIYGPASSSLCTVSFSGPQATLPCGPTYTAYNAYSTSSFVSGANAYRFSFYDAATDALVAVKTNTNNYVYFNQVPGLIFNKTYKWTVEVQYNNGSGNVFGPPSSNNCMMTWGTVYEGKESMVNNIAERTDFMLTDEEDVNLANVYPNPNNGDFTIQLPVTSEIDITNVLGEKIMNQVLFEGQSDISLSNQPTGIYFVRIRTGNSHQVIKVIKEN